jgi:hypothetical protein
MTTVTLTPRQLDELKSALLDQLNPDGLGPKWVTDLINLLEDSESEGE